MIKTKTKKIVMTILLVMAIAAVTCMGVWYMFEKFGNEDTVRETNGVFVDGEDGDLSGDTDEGIDDVNDGDASVSSDADTGDESGQGAEPQGDGGSKNMNGGGASGSSVVQGSGGGQEPNRGSGDGSAGDGGNGSDGGELGGNGDTGGNDGPLPVGQYRTSEECIAVGDPIARSDTAHWGPYACLYMEDVWYLFIYNRYTGNEDDWWLYV